MGMGRHQSRGKRIEGSPLEARGPTVESLNWKRESGFLNHG